MRTSAELGSLRRVDPGTGAFANSAPMIFPRSRLVPIMKPWGAAPYPGLGARDRRQEALALVASTIREV